MKASPPHESDRRTHGFLGDEDGASMLEFVLLAPVLCYLMVGVFFFHHHIDYAQDSAARFRHMTWRHAVPGGINVTDAASDEGGFTPILSIKNAIRLAPAAGTSGFSGGLLLTAERYFGATANKTPYTRIRLNAKSFWARQEAVAPIPPNRWAPILGGLGRFFGNKFGGNPWREPTGHDQDWEEKFPMIVDPWQRNLNRNNFKQLAVTSALEGVLPFGLGVEEAMEITNVLTALILPIPPGRSRTFSNVHKVDSVLNGNTRGNALPLKTFSKSQMQKIVK